MERIDLTLRREFTSNPRLHFEDTRIYESKLGYEDQRRAKLSILSLDTFYSIWGIKITSNQHEDFFDRSQKIKTDSTIQLHEDVHRITGMLTKYLAMEYDAGYGREDVCDCCGGFRSRVLNSFRYGLCDRCNKEDQLDNKNFWERRPSFQEAWID